MTDFSGGYKIVTVGDKTGIIAANHKTRELLVSKDVKLKTTDKGELCAIFPNSQPQKKSKIPFLSKKNSDTDCSVTISNPSKFNHCIKKDGAYQLSGSNVTFNGSDNDNTLILNGVENSEINMQGGNDTVLYREKSVANNNINLGDGDNTFAPTYKTDIDKPLINNKITSGKGQDNIYLRSAIGNTVDTGAGDDLVQIESDVQKRFQNNLINTEKGNDKVNINGDFNKFSNNEFYLGKGSDTFSAEINPNDDAKTEFEYNSRLSEYAGSVSKNKIYATDGEKGFFEKNIFESKTHNANQLSEYNVTTARSEGFQEFTTKPVPQEPISDTAETVTSQPHKKLTREDYSRRYSIGSMGAMLFNDSKMQEMALKALDDYVKSMAE